MNRPLVAPTSCSCTPLAEQLLSLLKDEADAVRNDDIRPILFDAKRLNVRCGCTDLPMLVAIAIEVTEPACSASLCYASWFQRQAVGRGLTLEDELTFAELRLNALASRVGRSHYRLRMRYEAAVAMAVVALKALKEKANSSLVAT